MTESSSLKSFKNFVIPKIICTNLTISMKIHYPMGFGVGVVRVRGFNVFNKEGMILVLFCVLVCLYPRGTPWINRNKYKG